MRLTVLLFSFLFCLSAIAQEEFSGEVTYEISYEDLDDQIKAMESMLPKSMTVEMRDGMSKTIQPNAMGGETIVIVNNENGETLTLLNIMGNKMAIKSNANDKEDEEGNVEVEYTEETKEIAGYECKKAIATTEDGTEVIIYYTNELPSASVSDNAYNIDGFPMMIELSQEMFTMITTVTKVEEKKMKKIIMEIPEGYTEKTPEELKQLMQGGGM